MEKNNLAKVAIGIKKVYDKIITMTPGELITWTELEELCGKPCSNGGKGYDMVYSARRRAEKAGIFFSSVRGEGIQRLSNIDASRSIGEKGIATITARASLDKKRLKYIDYESLSKQDKKEWNTNLMTLSAVMLISTPGIINQVEIKVKNSLNLFEVQNTVDQLERASDRKRAIAGG